MRKLGWIAMTVLALLIAVYAGMVLFLPGFGPPFIAERRVVMPVALVAHLAGGLSALALGPWQLNSRLRGKYLDRHRWTGRAYVIAVTVGGLGALAMAPVTQEGPVTHFGFGLLGVMWLFTTFQAYRRIRAHDREAHRRWMLRSYSLTLAAVTLRIYLPLSQVAGIPFGDAYRAISWLCWVPNLVIAELVIMRRRTQPVPA